jgi:hypothetical protein
MRAMSAYTGIVVNMDLNDVKAFRAEQLQKGFK